MSDKKYEIFRTITILLTLLGLTTACMPQEPINAPVPTEIALLPGGTPETTSTLLPEPTPISESTDTALPLTLFLAEFSPTGMITDFVPTAYKRSNESDNTLWFGPIQQAPQGDILQNATWVYALVAPFPTILDDISSEQFQQLWFGQLNEPDFSVNALYVPDTIAKILKEEWGVPDGTLLKEVEIVPGPDVLWEENAWAIIPFDELHPKLKVISIDGKSPLFKDFAATDYPLSFQYQVVKDKSINSAYSMEDIQNLVQAINTTNRDPEKMTTLVMTGVTALVRATAYKMEEKGVLYPGEAIVGWLSEADLTHISNEVSFYEDCPFPDPNSRSLFFCSDPKYIELLEYVGTDIIELTGNHNNDVLFVYGDDVVSYNLGLYTERGWVYYGGGSDLQDASAPKIIEHNGNNLAFIGCNASGPDFAWATETQGGAARCGDYQWMVDEISRLNDEGSIPIATLQYYEDYYNYPAEHHVHDFGLLADAGAAIVNGSQAHRPKGMAFSSGAFIDYGLGNLFFDQMGIIDAYGNQILQTRWEVIQRHTFYDGRHISTELLTAMLEDYAKPRPMTSRERIIFLEELFTASSWDSR
jgi:poly-gamma-glutamate synthesis protein (capsule biosynthesis protein)